MKIRKGDTVLVKIGKDQGKRGRVENVHPKDGRLVVEGVNMITRHVKPSAGVRQGGRIQQEAPIHISNVLLICNSCNEPTRIGYHRLEDGSKVRLCRKCKETIS